MSEGPHQIEQARILFEIVGEPDAVPPCTFEQVYFGTTQVIHAAVISGRAVFAILTEFVSRSRQDAVG